MSVHCSSCHEQFCQALRDKCFELDYSELKMKYFRHLQMYRTTQALRPHFSYFQALRYYVRNRIIFQNSYIKFTCYKYVIASLF